MNESAASKKVRYRLNDYYLRFYFTFINGNRERIEKTGRTLSFDEVIGSKWHTYSGHAFENIVSDHANSITQKAGFENQLIRTGSYWQKPTKRKKGVQIDIVIECSGNTTLICECKWSRKKAGTDAVEELLRKVSLYPNKLHHTLIPVLVAPAGVTKSVENNRNIIVVTINDFFR